MFFFFPETKHNKMLAGQGQKIKIVGDNKGQMRNVNMNLPQEVKVDGGELGLNQSPQTPEEMRCLDTERERARERISADSCYSKSECRL